MGTIVTLLIAGIVLLLIEIIVPGGIVGSFGALCIISGIVLGFVESFQLGLILLFAAIIFGSIALWAWVRFFPDSKMGKEVFLDKSGKDWQGYSENNAEFLGQSGVSHTPLRPSGMAVINDKRVNVVTQGELIEQDRTITVIKVEGNRIVVSAVT